jgi:hypothetical protein
VREVEEMIQAHGEDVRALAIPASLDAPTKLLKTLAGKLFINSSAMPKLQEHISVAIMHRSGDGA